MKHHSRNLGSSRHKLSTSMSVYNPHNLCRTGHQCTGYWIKLMETWWLQSTIIPSPPISNTHNLKFTSAYCPLVATCRCHTHTRTLFKLVNSTPFILLCVAVPISSCMTIDGNRNKPYSKEEDIHIDITRAHTHTHTHTWETHTWENEQNGDHFLFTDL